MPYTPDELHGKTVAELRQMLAEAELAEREARKAAIKAFVLDWRYTIKLVTPRTGVSFDKMYDSTCARYKIDRTLLNRDEAKLSGVPDHEMREGGMEYIYNKLTCRIICSSGGGTIYISEDWSAKDQDKDHADERAMLAIGAFLIDHPKGGDITEIITAFEAERAAARAAREK